MFLLSIRYAIKCFLFTCVHACMYVSIKFVIFFSFFTLFRQVPFPLQAIFIRLIIYSKLLYVYIPKSVNDAWLTNHISQNNFSFFLHFLICWEPSINCEFGREKKISNFRRFEYFISQFVEKYSTDFETTEIWILH